MTSSSVPSSDVDRVLAFERNDGQAPSDVRFIARGAAVDAAFSRGQVLLTRREQGRTSEPMALRFANGRSVEPASEWPLEGRVNYLRGRDPSKWIRRVPTYERVRYAQLYDGIDLVFHGAGRTIEYDFEIAPHADPSVIALRFDTATLNLDRTGALVVRRGDGTFRQPPPVAYQDLSAGRRQIGARYRIDGASVSIELDPYDHELPLVIDPVIAYASLVGGTTADDVFNAVAADRSGHAFLVGAAFSTDFPTTIPPEKLPNPDNLDNDVFVEKLSADGRSFIFSTLIGGSGADNGTSIAVDPTGAVYVGGRTNSSDFPLGASAFDVSCGSTNGIDNCPDEDAFVLKLSPDGSSLVYSTYLGGARTDAVLGIAVNSRGAAFVTGWTASTDFPVTSTAFSRTLHQPADAFYAILLADGGLSYATLIGGNGSDMANAIAIDGGDNAYIGGFTGSTDFPIKGGVQSTMTHLPGRTGDGWVAKFDGIGRLQFSTFFGGMGGDSVRTIAVHSTGIYIGGITDSPTLPGNANTGAVIDRDTFGFVSQLTGSGSRVIATRVVPASTTRVEGLAIGAGMVHVVGYTTASNFPTTSDAPEPANGRTASAYYATWPIDGSGVIGSTPNFATLLTGETQGTFGYGIAYDAAGGAYIGGIAFSDGPFPSVNAVEAPRVSPVGTEGPFVAHFVPDARFVSTDPRDIVAWMTEADVHGDWQIVPDPSAAGGRGLFEPDRGQRKIAAPSSSPANYAELTIDAQAGVTYRLWLRARAQKNSFSNDSVYVQFSDSVDWSGTPIWRIGTASATPVVLEDCTGCGVHGWGWQDNGYGAGVLGPTVRFATSGSHTVRIQQREDGISIDQILLSSSKYLTTAPGAPRDTTIVLRKTVLP